MGDINGKESESAFTDALHSWPAKRRKRIVRRILQIVHYAKEIPRGINDRQLGLAPGLSLYADQMPKLLGRIQLPIQFVTTQLMYDSKYQVPK